MKRFCKNVEFFLLFSGGMCYNTNMKMREVLENGVIKLTKYKIEEAIFKTRMLLLYEVGMKNEYLALHMEDEIGEEIIQRFHSHIQELIDGKPIQYITNEQSFYGFEFYVDENVLIPQPDTEILVEEVIDICRYREKVPKILDICTGSGAIAIAIAKNIKTQVMASDISQKALEIAQKNAKRNLTKVEWIKSDMFENIEEKFDVIVSNPPYIETQTIQNLSKEVKNEPRIALDGGQDGLRFYRILANESKNYLNEEGILAVEIGYNQKEKVIEIFEKAGFCEVYSKKDFGNQDRIVVGKWR